MRIAQLANFYGAESGGLRVTVDELRAGYGRAGHETVLIIPGRVDDEHRSGPHRVFSVRSPRLPRSGGYRIITDLRKVNDILDETRPDRIEVSDKTTLVHAATWARKHCVPAVLFSHERLDATVTAHVPRWVPVPRISAHWTRRLIVRFDTIVCASLYAAREFYRLGARNVAIVPLGVDLDTFRPRATRAARTHRWRLVYVGRLSREKRPDLALSSAHVLTERGVDVGLTVVGSGPMLDELRTLGAGMPVDFLGHLSERSVVAGELARADIAIVPSPGETFGLAALEALACGTPIVVSKTGGAAELVTGNAGAAAWPSAEAFAAAVLRLMDVSRLARETDARRIAEQYPWSRTVERLLAVHRQEFAQ